MYEVSNFSTSSLALILSASSLWCLICLDWVIFGLVLLHFNEYLFKYLSLGSEMIINGSSLQGAHGSFRETYRETDNIVQCAKYSDGAEYRQYGEQRKRSPNLGWGKDGRKYKRMLSRRGFNVLLVFCVFLNQNYTCT